MISDSSTHCSASISVSFYSLLDRYYRFIRQRTSFPPILAVQDNTTLVLFAVLLALALQDSTANHHANKALESQILMLAAVAE